MKPALAILCAVTLLAYRWWEFLCAQALGGFIQFICNLGFTP